MTLVGFATKFLSSLTVLSQIIIVAIILLSLFPKKKLSKKIKSFFSKNAVLISFIVALVAMLGSLFYSEIAGYEPCKLCWYQRILMYPLVFILGTALWKKDDSVSKYVLPMVFLGTLIAGYHYYIQMGGTAFASCDAANSCAKRFTFTFGYITIPMMALSSFSMIFVLMLLQRKNK